MDGELAAAEQRQVEQTCSIAAADPRLASLIPAAVPYDAGTATIQQLADPALFSSDQKEALAQWDTVMQACLSEQGLVFERWFAPAVSGIYRDHLQQGKLLRARAYSGAITIGQFNQARAELGQKTVASAEAAQQEYAHRQQAIEAQNAAAWSAAASALQQSRQTQIMQQQLQQQQWQNMQNNYQMNRPVQTNCNRYGNQVNCTSW